MCSPPAGLLELILAMSHSISFGLLAVDEVKSTRLDLAVDERTRKTGKDLLCLFVRGRVA